MHKKDIKLIAEKNTPNIVPEKISGSVRYDVVKDLIGNNNIGIELGVAKGDFSKKMIQTKKFSKFYGVDVYNDIHDVNEYKYALSNVGIHENYHLLRMTFDDAYDLFEDNYFDFIYIDGYAHTGEEGGETILRWYKKCKVGGVIAGDDYHDDWPLVKWAVNDFIKQSNLKLFITDKTEPTGFCKYPSWFAIKNDSDINFKISEDLKKISEIEKSKISQKRYWRVKIRNLERLYKKKFKGKNYE